MKKSKSNSAMCIMPTEEKKKKFIKKRLEKFFKLKFSGGGELILSDVPSTFKSFSVKPVI